MLLKRARSIPACAGEPLRRKGYDYQRWVYPRVCGGTPYHRTVPAARNGLSPRVRGNPDVLAPILTGGRSIPACAGEPLASAGRSPTGMVYPRVCGGTRERAFAIVGDTGLSPRVRGNQFHDYRPVGAGRSIPACAGEPVPRLTSDCVARVYPRVCGGTPFARPCRAGPEGLSPRVRGNHLGQFTSSFVLRSIPACAGEPANCASRIALLRVYPRVCGGTTCHALPSLPSTGLSPRVRGNREQGGV